MFPPARPICGGRKQICLLDPALNNGIGKFRTSRLRIASEAQVRDYSMSFSHSLEQSSDRKVANIHRQRLVVSGRLSLTLFSRSDCDPLTTLSCVV